MFIVQLMLLSSIQGIASGELRIQSDSDVSELNYFNQYADNFVSPDGSTITGYSKTITNTQYLALDQALIALNFLLAAENTPDPDVQKYLVAKALAVLKFSTSYLKDPYSQERNGTVMYYDDVLKDNTYTRAPRLARDQALMIWALNNALDFIDPETPLYTRYDDLIRKFWIFLDNQFYDNDNGGYFSKITPVSQTEVTLDESKRVSDNMLIGLALLSIDATRVGTTSEIIENRVQTMLDFFRSHFRQSELGLLSVGLANGTVLSSDLFFAKDSILYGLTNLAFYQSKQNAKILYLTEAKDMWHFVVDAMWEDGFGGIFGASNSDFLPIIAGKALEDQVLFGLLSARLMPYESDPEDQFTNFYLELDKIINLRYRSNTAFWASADRRLNPSNELFARPTAFAGYYLQETPHIIAIEYPDSVIIGAEIPLTIYTKMISGIALNLTLTSSSSFTKQSYLVNTSVSSIIVKFDSDIQPAQRQIHLSLSLSKTEFQTFDLQISLIANVRVPTELIYLVGAGILAGALLLLRRPPEWLNKRLRELNLTQINSSTESKDEDESTE